MFSESEENIEFKKNFETVDKKSKNDQKFDNLDKTSNEIKRTQQINYTMQSNKEKSLSKCTRKGSRICYANMENVTVLRKIPEIDMRNQKSSINNQSNKDEKKSGESLFKTFTFEQTRDLNDPETEKCIQFWKSVMEKNLAPIKCTLLESQHKTPTIIRTQSDENPKKISKRRKLKVQQSVEVDDDEKLNDFLREQEKIWSDALKEIRKRKLDQLRLYIKDRCDYCKDYFIKDLKNDLGVESKAEERIQISELNKWNPPDTKHKNSQSPDISATFSIRSKFSGKINRLSNSSKRESNELKPISEENEKIPPLSITKKLSFAAPPEQSPIPRDFSKEITSKELFSSSSSLPKRNASIQMPNVKCPCESDTCVCPHKAAKRNSLTSFIEIARKNMVAEDRSSENLSINKSFDTTCICTSHKKDYSCVSKSCPVSFPEKVEVQESSSDFNLDKILGKKEEVCICAGRGGVICPYETCKNKLSQGSLIEGFLKKKKQVGKSPCICTNSESANETCVNDVCPTKETKITDCTCGKELPWTQTVCQSPSCPSHNMQRLMRRRRKIEDDDEKITFKKHPPIREIAPNCICGNHKAWQFLECGCQKGTPPKRRFGSFSKSGSRLEHKKLIDPMEKTSIEKKQIQIQLEDECICKKDEPWKTVKCQITLCENKKVKSKLEDESDEPIDTECVCKDKTIEPICKRYDCKDKLVSVEYQPPCICPKNFDETKNDNPKCPYRDCTMKNIDRTCTCPIKPEAICDSKECETKPHPTKKILKSNPKPLTYSTQCICNVRGYRNTQEITCVAPECPFKKHPLKLPENKSPRLYERTPDQNYSTTITDNVGTHDECVCNDTDHASCSSKKCKRKIKKEHEHGDAATEDCVCVTKKLGSETEVICEEICCSKNKENDNAGISKIDKCCCANMETICDEPVCPNAVEIKIHKSDIDERIERPYCYICGHYDCASLKKKFNTDRCDEQKIDEN